MIQIKRTYESASRSDGRRFLVERLWPRGIKKDALAMEAWLADVAPSTTLRTWFGHRVDRWDEFQRRYKEELDRKPETWQPLLDAARRGTVTLLYSARDTEHNGALVLRDYLTRQLRQRARTQTAKPVRAAKSASRTRRR